MTYFTRHIRAVIIPEPTPLWNILILGTLAFVGSLFASYELASEIIVFGAFIGFVAVNLATIRQFYFLGVPGQRLGCCLT